MTFVGSLRLTMSSSPIIPAGGRVPRGMTMRVMCTSQSLLSKAHDDPLYLLNHAYNSVRCGAPTVIREAPLEYQTMICSQNLYNQRLATMCVYHQLTPISRRHHIYAVGGRGGAIAVQTWVCDGSYPVCACGATL